jgi:PIN domain nuclease of toxin-antitoxin system
LKFLLDTHSFLWFCSNDPRLNEKARILIEHADNLLFLSAASAWEIAIKFAFRRMPELGTNSPETFVPDRMRHYDLSPLPIQMDHTFRVAHLPPIHRDPFDRLLVSQAQVEGLPIITNDPNIARYDVEVIW